MALHTRQEMVAGNPPLTLGAIQVIVICSIFCPIAMLFVGLRFWARSMKETALAFNNYAILAAVLMNCGQTALLIYAAIAGGVSYHLSELGVRYSAAAVILAKCYVAAEPLWIATNSCIKFSILGLYMRIFITRNFRYLCYGMMTLTACYFLSTFIRMFFLCTPLEVFWNPTLPGAHCVDLSTAYIAVSAINLVIDVIIIVLPIPYVWRLQMRTHKKVAVSAMFSIGVFIAIVTSLRIVAVLQLDLSDTSYTVTPRAIWSELEPCLGIVNACIPILQPVANKIATSTGYCGSMRSKSQSTYLMRSGGSRPKPRFTGIPGETGTTVSIGSSRPQFQRLKDVPEDTLGYDIQPREGRARKENAWDGVKDGITVTSEISVQHV